MPKNGAYGAVFVLVAVLVLVAILSSDTPPTDVTIASREPASCVPDMAAIWSTSGFRAESTFASLEFFTIILTPSLVQEPQNNESCSKNQCISKKTNIQNLCCPSCFNCECCIKGMKRCAASVMLTEDGIEVCVYTSNDAEEKIAKYYNGEADKK